MKKRNGWCYAFWILIIVVLILALMVGLVAWGGSRNEDEVEEGNEATVASVSISPTEMSLKMGATEEGTLTATVTMDDGTTSTSETVSWTSSDPTVATVTETGYTASVTALKAGETEITASVGTVTSDKCTVTVAEADSATVKDVTISGTLALAYGDETGTTLTASVTMSDDSDYEGDYTWSSDDEEKVVKVTGSGASVTVMPVSCGTAEITVAVADNKSATCTVTVSEDHEAAESGRITGSADVADDYHFMFDDEYEEGTTVVFDDSSVSAEYDADTNTYTLSGLSGKMTADQATAFWGSTDATDHVGHEYIGFIVNVNEGETVMVESYSSTDADATPDETFTFTSPDEDTSFLVDIADHDGDGVCTWYNVLTVTYAGGDVETYYVVLGEIFTPASTADDLAAVFESGGDVALVSDISVTGPVQVAAGVEVELDLAGHTIGLSGSGSYISYTIGVSLGGELTIIDSSEDGSGMVDTVGNNTAALINVGTTILKGGFFTRSAEAGMEETGNGDDSFYTVVNIGDMVIEDGATVYNAGDYSSCLINSNGTEVQTVYPNDRTESAKLTVNGGKIYGGKYSIRNGDSGELVMTGGTVGGLRSDTDTLPYRALNNYDDATITGGTLLGGNGGALDVNAGGHANNCTEGVVIFNEDGGTEHTLTIGDGKGNGPEIIYEGINPNAETDDDGNQPTNTSLTYYEEEETIPDFATGIAVYSGEVNVLAGTIECNDEIDDDERDYTFTGVYLTNGSLNVSGGKISGDYAVVIDHTAEADAEISFAITGGEIGGDVILYFTDESGDTVASVYTPGGVIVPSDEFEFNDETFDGFSGLDGDNLNVKDESGQEVEYTAGGITVTVTMGSDGSITYVVDGIVANQMSDEQKAAFDISYVQDEEETIRFYIAVQVAVQPGETVTVTGGEKSETVPNDTDEVIYDLWVIEIGQSHFSSVTSPTEDYLSVDLSSFTLSVSVTASDNSTAAYTIAFGNVFVPLQAWRCADGNHATSNTNWTVVLEETCGTDGYQVGVCDYCGETLTETIPATGNHTWDEGEVTVEPGCTTEGQMTYTCTVCGATKTETIPAAGHTAKTYSDGNMYAEYKDLDEDDEEEDYAWCALCEVCNEWFEIGEEDIYDFVLVAQDEDSLDAAIEVAGKREDGSETNRTQILVYGTIEISDENYVLIDCDNVEIYGLGAESSKIIESKYEGTEGNGTAQTGVDITGSNVTIRDLTIDGSKLDDSANHYDYEHGLEILGSAANVTLSNCTIIGGTTKTSSAVVLMGGSETGYLLIENCTLSGYHGITIEHDGSNLEVTISGGTIGGSYYGILIDAGSGVYLNVVDAEVYGKNSLTTDTTSAIFTNCTFGYNVYENKAYGSMGVYCDVTLIDCTFLANDTGCSDAYDGLVNDSRNYVIQAREPSNPPEDFSVTITLIGCTFENTNSELEGETLDVTADNFIYIVGAKSINCYLYFSDPTTSLQYVYDATAQTVEHNHGEDDWDEGTVTVEPTCTETGEMTYTCGVCGATKTIEIAALGHTVTEQSDGNMYAVYSTESWYTQCERCGEWVVEIDDGDIYEFILVAKDETSLDAAIDIAGDRQDGSADDRTMILVYGEIEISDTSYVLIDCDNVEIYGLGVEESKIIDSAYDGVDPEGKDVATSGVEISGKNVTIRNLTIDGTALNEISDNHTYKHAVEIKGGAENVLISDCVVIGGGTDLETDSSICIMEATGIVKIENCSLSGAHNGLVIEHNGQDIDITVSGGKIDAIRPIWIDGGHGVTLLVENAEIYGRNSFGGEATSIKFSNCTFGFHISDSGYIAYGAVSTYGDVTLEKCTFLSHETGTNLEDFPVKNSNNYAIQARQDGVTITIIDCEFENTHDDLDIGKLSVDEDNVIYIIAYLSYSFNVVIGDSEDALEYIYDSTSHTVEHNHTWVVISADATTSSYICYGCGATKTEITVDHVESATPSTPYVVTTVGGTLETPTFAVTMFEGTVYDSIDAYLEVYTADSVTWASSDTSVAMVDATTGAITIVGAGNTTITVTFTSVSVTASYMLCVGDAITAADPLIGEWYGEDEVKASVSIMSLDLNVEVYVTVTESGFTLRVVDEAFGIDMTIWEDVAWFKAGDEYYIVVEEADGSYELIEISYSNDSGSEQLSTTFNFTFEYTLFGVKMDVDVVVTDATLERITEGEGDTSAEEVPDDDDDDDDGD